MQHFRHLKDPGEVVIKRTMGKWADTLEKVSERISWAMGMIGFGNNIGQWWHLNMRITLGVIIKMSGKVGVVAIRAWPSWSYGYDY